MAAGILTRRDACILGTHWLSRLFEYDTDDTLLYRGYNAVSATAATSDDDWVVWKYTWTSGYCTKIQGPLDGAWDDRATLGWS